MSTADTIKVEETGAVKPGVRLHHFTIDEYRRMGEAGVLSKGDPVELLDGYLFIKLDSGPPYDVPLGIPHESFAGREVPQFPQRKFTVREYRRLMEAGIFHPALRTELVEGWVIDKMTRGPRHDSCLQRSAETQQKRLSDRWRIRLQSAIVLDDGEPEPDLVIVPGPAGRFDHEHPRPHEVIMLVEIADSTLQYDRGPKLRDYARNSIAQYWIVDLLSRTVEVYQNPSGATDLPRYSSFNQLSAGQMIPLIFGHEQLDPIAVDELLPSS